MKNKLSAIIGMSILMSQTSVPPIPSFGWDNDLRIPEQIKPLKASNKPSKKRSKVKNARKQKHKK